jgi:hypothetical protein
VAACDADLEHYVKQLERAQTALHEATAASAHVTVVQVRVVCVCVCVRVMLNC